MGKYKSKDHHGGEEITISTSDIWFGDSQRRVIRFQCQDMIGIVGNAQNSFYIATNKEIPCTST